MTENMKIAKLRDEHMCVCEVCQKSPIVGSLIVDINR